MQVANLLSVLTTAKLNNFNLIRFNAVRCADLCQVVPLFRKKGTLGRFAIYLGFNQQL